MRHARIPKPLSFFESSVARFVLLFRINVASARSSNAPQRVAFRSSCTEAEGRQGAYFRHKNNEEAGSTSLASILSEATKSEEFLKKQSAAARVVGAG